MKKAKMPEDTTLQHIPQPSEAAKLPQLPPLSIDTMTQVELQDFIPQLVSIVMANKTGLYRKNCRPEWWPSDIPWTGTRADLLYQESNWSEPLRDAIRKCYRHMGQERLLKMNKRDNSKQAATSSNSNKPGDRTESSPRYYKSSTENAKKTCQYAEIYICYFCEREFSDRTLMREHQAECRERPPQLQEAMKTPPQSTDSTQGPPQMSPVKLDLNCKTPKIPKDGFIKLFNLVPKQKADRILARHRNSLDVECDELDYSVPDTPISPTTPRTPKSLISQLSRDEGVSSRKRLSYSEPLDNEDKESVVSGCSEEAEEKTTQKGKSLLTIDVSSLLGQRIQKHVKVDSFMQVIGDSESFCKTPVKNSFYEKLRNRTITYPLSYRPRRKHDGKFVHEYGFTSRQKMEIKERLKSGLNKNGRQLLKSIPKCSVDVARLTKWELRRFLSKYSYRKFLNLKPVVHASEPEFPKEPLLLSQNVDKLLGLKKRSEMRVSKLNQLAPVNVVSEDANAEITKQKLTLYRCLLSDLAAMQSNLKKSKKSAEALQQSLQLKLEQIPGNLHRAKKIKRETPGLKASKLPLSPPSTPIVIKHQDHRVKKRPFQTQPDDDISIISISSDEESVNSRCCIACKKRKLCPCSPEVSLERVSSTEPLDVSIVRSASISPQISPCSCVSTPESDSSLHLKLSPSPSPDLVHWHTRTSRSPTVKDELVAKPLLKSPTEKPASPSVSQRGRPRGKNSLHDTVILKEKSVSSQIPVKKPLVTSTPRMSPRKSSQQPAIVSPLMGNVQNLPKETDRSAMKKIGSEGTKAAARNSPQKKSSPAKKIDIQDDLVIRTRSKAGVPLKRSKRILSAFSQGSPKKYK
ncbi:uncharacterized protein LOC125654843 isoform X4 [Ostrea edulis]|uniref:uncharacterized protein LOC125654843 isoform X4 n=1 Tax=Ostrea edulis TaxID=37623 RepID=UPI0024AEFAA2|nr:uncharacterized protein LOC125654843 isoform X4 [Ostrea edulis]